MVRRGELLIRLVLLVHLRNDGIIAIIADALKLSLESSLVDSAADILSPRRGSRLVQGSALFDTLSSEEFIPFAFSYTESCRCSINVLNYSKSEYKEKYICVFGK